MRVWVLSQFYDCPEHDWPWPVCTAYGVDPHGPGRLSAVNTDFALVSIETSPVHIEAMKQDARIVYCGRDYDTPPPELLSTYQSKLDPMVQYMFIGQVIARLAQTEPAFYAKN